MESSETLTEFRESAKNRERTVGDIMSTQLLSCSPDTSVADAAARMSDNRLSSILIRDESGIRGIWTERDALSHDFHKSPGETRIAEVMSAPVETIDHQTTVSDAAVQFKKRGLRHYVVVDDAGAPCGLVTQSDLVINHGVEWFMRLQPVASALSAEPPIADATTSVAEVARLMNSARQDAMLVYTPEADPGILTERDIVRYLGEQRAETEAWRVATRPVIEINRNDSLFHARNVMLQNRIRHLGVTDEAGAIVSLIGFTSILETIEHGYIEELEQALAERDAALRASEERYRALVELSPDAIAVHREREILFINQAGARLLGADSPTTLHGRSLDEFLRADQSHNEAGLVELEDKTADEAHEARLTRLDGGVVDIELTARSITYNEQLAHQVVMRDISHRKELEQELRRLATTDHLTGLCNRHHFESHLDQAVQEATRYERMLALIMLDLDDFKSINDTHGHDAGDTVLQRVVEQLQGSVRATDILARWGGEEFMVLAPETTLSGAGKLAEKLRAAVAQVRVEDWGAVTASAGVAAYRTGDDRESLLKRVDDAVFAAKRHGRDRSARAD